MDKNMSDIDRALRGFIVAPIAVLFAWIAGWTTVLGLVLLGVAAILVVTAIVGFCPLYALIGVRTKARTL